MKLARIIAHTIICLLAIAMLATGCKTLDADLSGALCLFVGILFGASWHERMN